jgi:flagellar export protein FliJ
LTRFHFPLQRVLDWRKTQLELEEAKFQQAAGALAAVDRARAELQAAFVHTEHEVRRWGHVGGSDLGALSEYRAHVRTQEGRLAARRAECARAVAAQQAAMLEARRRCRLLERLKERRLAEWKAAADREVDETASESFLAQWGSPDRSTL